MMKTDKILQTDSELKSKIKNALREYFISHKKDIAGRSFPVWIRIEEPVEDMDPLSWLNHQPHAEKIFWSERSHRFTVAGVGTAHEISLLPAVPISGFFSHIRTLLKTAPAELKYFGGMRFNPHQQPDDIWQSFGRARFRVPRFEMVVREQKTFAACNILLQPEDNVEMLMKSVLEELAQLRFETVIPPESLPRLVHRQDVPDYSNWADNVRSALSAFSLHEMEKIVLARRSSFQFAGAIHPLTLLKRLRNANPEAFHFCFQTGNQAAFIGASPERLYLRQGMDLQTEAVAGTLPRGVDLTEDQQLGERLLNSKKDRWEHWLVVESIENIMNRFCAVVFKDESVSLLKLARLQHLYMGFRGQLSNGYADADILSRLHPTPAVGGFPTEKALAEIRKFEKFDRGWYAGPVGWIGQDNADFAVGIRSGLVEGARLHLFSGAGIVEGSEPQAEWEEIENKITNFMRIFSDDA